MLSPFSIARGVYSIGHCDSIAIFRPEFCATDWSRLHVALLPEKAGLDFRDGHVTADWITYVGSVSRFSLCYPKYWAVGRANPQNCTEAERSDFTAGANADLVAEGEPIGRI